MIREEWQKVTQKVDVCGQTCYPYTLRLLRFSVDKGTGLHLSITCQVTPDRMHPSCKQYLPNHKSAVTLNQRNKATHWINLTSSCVGWSIWSVTTSLNVDINVMNASTLSDFAHAASVVSSNLLTCRTSARHSTSSMSPVKHSTQLRTDRYISHTPTHTHTHTHIHVTAFFPGLPG